MVCLEIKDLGVVNKFLGLRIMMNDKCGYVLDQEVMIDVLLKDHGLDIANGVRAPIDKGCNEIDSEASDILNKEEEFNQASIKGISVSRWEPTLDCAMHSTGYQFCSALCSTTDAQTDHEGLEDGQAYRKIFEGNQDVEAVHQ